MKKNLIMGLMLLVMLIISACSQETQSGEEKEERITPVETALVSKGNLQVEKEVIGRAMPDTNIGIVPKANGELIQLNVARGDTVEKGQVIGRVDAGNAQENVELQEIALRQARSQLKSAQNQKDQAQQGLQDAQERLKQAKIQNENNDTSSSVGVDNALIQFQDAQRNEQRMKELYEEGAVSLQKYEQAQVQAQQAENQLEQARKSLQTGNSSGQSSLQQAKIGVTQAQQQLDNAQISVEQAQLQVEQAQVQLRQARNQAADTSITATATGEVVQVNAEVGDMVSNQQPIATVVNLNPIKVDATVAAEELPLFKKGKDIPAYINPIELEEQANVSYISPVTNDSGLYPIEAVIANSNSQIKPGMMVTLQLPEITVENSILVPTSAVIEENDEAFVYIIEEERAKKTPVTIVRTQSDITAVKGELSEGDQVVIKGQLTLADGNKVSIMKEDE
ncbi:efflux RND transporter periplasmic adaptor subunit [Pontibacillus marinus]|uniref:RND efflux pump membrane fusion protein barrel-sandwich domain-containing protein n=1 Tax=Pontibacillus marinus BH030004 = DSM 16465 TaxID=1385511 RepID=A0A0A5GIJ4_9BACI|nr:efflux RND transporter periplasmic adaptor subunit [Pontibacillus marinus]KGX91018.1 hypothetical protein N783_13305 [Pontibacillus marinus BH030004 = DSM 16465]